MISDHAKQAIDICAERGAVFVTSTDAWLAIGSDERELIALLRYAKEKGVVVHVVPTIVKPEKNDGTQ